MTSRFNFAILYVDDEPLSLKYFKEIFGDLAPIITSECPHEALEIYEEKSDQIGLVLSDHRMPKMRGIQFLDKVMKINPLPLRFLITAFADLSLAVDLLNSDLLYGYLSKPWDHDELEIRLANALEFYSLSLQRDRLLKEKSIAFNQLIVTDQANTINLIAAEKSKNSISSILDSAPEEISNSSQWETFCASIRSELDHKVQSFSTTSVNHASIDLHQIFSETAHFIDSKGKSIETKFNQDNTIQIINADLQQLQRLSRQLYAEAVDNMPETGGEIHIQFSHSPQGLKIDFRADGKAFEETDFEARNQNNISVNLLGSYLTVQLLGGSMNVESTPSEGNRIEIEIPIADTDNLTHTNVRESTPPAKMVELCS